MSLPNLRLYPGNTPGTFILDSDYNDPQLLFVEDLQHLRDLVDGLLPRTPHNHDATDPDAHVLFASVCCGAQLYRCGVVADGLPSKPIIAQGEASCRVCGAELAQF